MVELQSVCYAHGSTPVLRDVSLTIRPQQILAVLGPNGAGKSTLLHLIAGSLAPASGTVLFDGVPLHHIRGKQLAQRRAVVQQTTSLTSPYTVLDLVLMGRMPHTKGGETPLDRDIALHALAALQIQHLAHRPYTALSGGEQQRVHIARALAQLHHPDSSAFRLLLLDEPTAHLDIGQSHHLLERLRALCSPTLAIVMVVHDINLAARYANRIALVHRGMLHAEGTPLQVLTPDAIALLYNIQASIWSEPVSQRPIIVPQ